LCELSGLSFVPTCNTFAAQAAHDDLVEASGTLKAAAVALMKVGNDLRLLCSGPRAGLGELILEPMEPGSSIMPGKVNPTQIEALTMVCAQVIGNDVAATIAGLSGQLELNAFKPVLIFNLLMAARNLGDACESFAERGIAGLEADVDMIGQHVQRSLMLVTALSPHVGYEKAARIAQKAHLERTTLRQAALALGWVSAEDFDRWVDPARMLGPTVARN
jgi:fumarate hydratase class II